MALLKQAILAIFFRECNTKLTWGWAATIYTKECLADTTRWHQPSQAFRFIYPISHHLHSVSKETFLRGFFLGPRVRVMWPRVMGNLHMYNPIFMGIHSSPKKGNYTNVAILLRLSVYRIVHLTKNFLLSLVWPGISQRWSGSQGFCHQKIILCPSIGSKWKGRE